jgi:hypothetical protein
MLHAVASHNSYHIGPAVVLRQILSKWSPPSGGLIWRLSSSKISGGFLGSKKRQRLYAVKAWRTDSFPLLLAVVILHVTCSLYWPTDAASG